MSERARQFMPFAALKGYYDLIAERERLKEPRHELTEEESAELSYKLSKLTKGSVCQVTYYACDAYEMVTGAITGIDYAKRLLRIIRQQISFDDILKIEYK